MPSALLGWWSEKPDKWHRPLHSYFFFTMLASSILRTTIRSQGRKKIPEMAALASAASKGRTFTQPSTANKANVLDIPSSRLASSENNQGIWNLCYNFDWMLRPRIESSTSKLQPHQHPSPASSLNPIYLDAQVWYYHFIEHVQSFNPGI